MLPSPSPEMRAQVLKNKEDADKRHLATLKREIRGQWFLEYFSWRGGSAEDNDCHRVRLKAKDLKTARLEARKKWNRLQKDPVFKGTAYRPTLLYEQYLKTPLHPTEPGYKKIFQ